MDGPRAQAMRNSDQREMLSFGIMIPIVFLSSSMMAIGSQCDSMRILLVGAALFTTSLMALLVFLLWFLIFAGSDVPENETAGVIRRVVSLALASSGRKSDQPPLSTIASSQRSLSTNFSFENYDFSASSDDNTTSKRPSNLRIIHRPHALVAKGDGLVDDSGALHMSSRRDDLTISVDLCSNRSSDSSDDDSDDDDYFSPDLVSRGSKGDDIYLRSFPTIFEPSPVHNRSKLTVKKHAQSARFFAKPSANKRKPHTAIIPQPFDQIVTL